MAFSERATTGPAGRRAAVFSPATRKVGMPRACRRADSFRSAARTMVWRTDFLSATWHHELPTGKEGITWGISLSRLARPSAWPTAPEVVAE
jgi:hypothetical protein